MAKITITKNEKKEIDWSIKGQLLISEKGDRVIISNGNSDKDSFEGTQISNGEFHDEWLKSYFTLFNGTITIEQ
jgi:hypothetical protein